MNDFKPMFEKGDLLYEKGDFARTERFIVLKRYISIDGFERIDVYSSRTKKITEGWSVRNFKKAY